MTALAGVHTGAMVASDRPIGVLPGWLCGGSLHGLLRLDPRENTWWDWRYPVDLRPEADDGGPVVAGWFGRPA